MLSHGCLNLVGMNLSLGRMNWRKKEKCFSSHNDGIPALPLLMQARGNFLLRVWGKLMCLFLECRVVYLLSVPWESSVGFCGSTDESAG